MNRKRAARAIQHIAGVSYQRAANAVDAGSASSLPCDDMRKGVIEQMLAGNHSPAAFVLAADLVVVDPHPSVLRLGNFTCYDQGDGMAMVDTFGHAHHMGYRAPEQSNDPLSVAKRIAERIEMFREVAQEVEA